MIITQDGKINLDVLRKNMNFEDFENGYIVSSPIGRIALQNSSPSDTCVPLAGFGVINVTRAVAELSKKSPPRKIPITPELWAQVSQVAVGKEAFAALTPKLRNRPILFLKRGTRLDLVDGVVQIQARRRHGLKHVQCVFVEPQDLEAFRVRFFRILESGEMEEFQPF